MRMSQNQLVQVILVEIFFRHIKNVLSRQDNSKTKLRCFDNVLHQLGWVLHHNDVINMSPLPSVLTILLQILF